MNVIHRAALKGVLALGAALLAATLLSGALAVPAAAGPIGLQAAGGWYTESDEFFLNGGLRFGVGTLTVIPNIDYVFVQSGSVYSLNADATMSLMPLGVASVYAGGGIGLLTSDPEVGSKDTQTVVNLLAGVGLNAAPMKPFAQLKYVFAEGNDPLAFSIGVRF